MLYFSQVFRKAYDATRPDPIGSGRLLAMLDEVYIEVKSSHWGLIAYNKHAIAQEEKVQRIFDSSFNQEIIVTQ